MNSLKIKQKDEIVLPQRTKISFLFDIKKAANIDDQTLYFLCIGAVNEIKETEASLHDQLQPFMHDILHESSVEFYRGTKTKEELEIVDEKLESLLSVLSPHYLDVSPTHQIIEYLVRIYEIHAFHKYSLIFGFVPLFETPWFLKACQLVSLKDDQWLDWLHDFAFKGEQVTKITLIKAMLRNKG